MRYVKRASNHCTAVSAIESYPSLPKTDLLLSLGEELAQLNANQAPRIVLNDITVGRPGLFEELLDVSRLEKICR